MGRLENLRCVWIPSATHPFSGRAGGIRDSFAGVARRTALTNSESISARNKRTGTAKWSPEVSRTSGPGRIPGVAYYHHHHRHCGVQLASGGRVRL